MNISDLIVESQQLEEIASKIQGTDQSGLVDEEIRAFVERYQNWYTDCLTVLPERSPQRFRLNMDSGVDIGDKITI
ncbi:MAG: hypothetical protein U0401_26120 [Anaerolineae bacterium]